MIRTLIVDDEAPARLGIRNLIERTTDFRVVAEAGDGPDALAAARRHLPDVVFLDVQMPGLGGLEVAAMLDRHDPPLVVFVSAYDRYALRAFEVHALDYILKPITPSRFREALARVRSAVAGRERVARHDRLVAFLETALRETESTVLRPATMEFQPKRLTVRDRDRYVFIAPADIDWIDCEGNYARLHVGAMTYRIRATLAALEQDFHPAGLVRIHRALAVNRARIREVCRGQGGELVVVLRDGRELPIGRRYRRPLLGQE